MAHDPDCIFCQIISGDIPCLRLYEDAKSLAFMDVSPLNPGHALVIPLHHAANVFESPQKWVLAAMATAQRIARAVRETLHPPGMTLYQSNGAAAAQSVMHFHIHVIPRAHGDNLPMNWKLKTGDLDEIAGLAARIRVNVN